MKIVYDNQIFSQQRYGGISRYFVEIASRLSNCSGINVTILASVYVNSYLKGLRDMLSIYGLYLPKFPKSGRLYSLLNKILYPVISFFQTAEIVHETYYTANEKGSFKAKRILTVYDMIHEKFPESFSNNNFLKIKKSAIERVDHIICISEHTKTDLTEIYGISPDKISVVYLGVDMVPSVKDELPVAVRVKPYLLYVGARKGYKNFSALLDAYANSKELRDKYNLIAFGGGDFTKDEQIQILSKQLKVGVNVIQLGGSDELLSSLYKHASVFVYPSLYEGFGLPPLEAMSQKCPVVCSNTSSIPEVVGNAGEYFDPYNSDDLSRAITSVLSDKSRQNELVVNGTKRIGMFSWDACANNTLDVYRKVLQ